VTNQEDDIELVVWTRERILADLRMVFFVLCIGITVFLTIRTYLPPH